jgi:hypothetical protein
MTKAISFKISLIVWAAGYYNSPVPVAGWAYQITRLLEPVEVGLVNAVYCKALGDPAAKAVRALLIVVAIWFLTLIARIICHRIVLLFCTSLPSEEGRDRKGV